MHIKQFLTGGDRNYGYLVADEASGKAIIIDPSFSPLSIVEYAREQNFSIEFIVCTHGHDDHTNGNDIIEQYTDIKPLCYGDVEPISNLKIEHNTELPLGNLNITVLHTPGHTKDSICLFIGDAVFTGDTLFVGKVGGTSSVHEAHAEFDSLHQVLMKLPPYTKVYPGHNYGSAPQSTIEQELKTNPFIMQPDLDAFISLKNNWATYKKEHGIA